MEIKAYEGYFRQGRFIPLNGVKIPEGSKAIVTLLNQSVEVGGKVDEQLAAMEAFIEAVQECDEEVPEFKRVAFKREVEI